MSKPALHGRRPAAVLEDCLTVRRQRNDKKVSSSVCRGQLRLRNSRVDQHAHWILPWRGHGFLTSVGRCGSILTTF
jgi:hypothetical protein